MKSSRIWLSTSSSVRPYQSPCQRSRLGYEQWKEKKGSLMANIYTLCMSLQKVITYWLMYWDWRWKKCYYGNRRKQHQRSPITRENHAVIVISYHEHNGSRWASYVSIAYQAYQEELAREFTAVPTMGEQEEVLRYSYVSTDMPFCIQNIDKEIVLQRTL